MSYLSVATSVGLQNVLKTVGGGGDNGMETVGIHNL